VVAAVRAAGQGPAAWYAVQPGDTLAGIAVRFAVAGGWPGLYAVNRAVIGADPGVIRPGMVLVLPGVAVPGWYRVAAGDSLAGIAAGLGVRGGWPALYAVNRAVIGADPGVIRPGMVLRVPGPAGSSPAAANPAHPAPAPAPPPAPAGGHRPVPVPAGGHRPVPVRTTGPGAAGMPRWLETVLLAAGLLAGLAFLAEPVLVLSRSRRRRAARLRLATADPAKGPPPARGRIGDLVPGGVPRGRPVWCSLTTTGWW
jgi:LysM repeat protein